MLGDDGERGWLGEVVEGLEVVGSSWAVLQQSGLIGDCLDGLAIASPHCLRAMGGGKLGSGHTTGRSPDLRSWSDGETSLRAPVFVVLD